MTVKNYCQAIVDALEGNAAELADIPPGRLDWDGTSLFLDLFHKTSGRSRTAFIDAIGQVIEQHTASPAAVAELIYIAASLDLAEVEPQVRALGAEPFGLREPVKRAVDNFLGVRSLAFMKPGLVLSARPTPASHPNGNVGTPKVAAKRSAVKEPKARP